ncbi:MAG: hypothetical protein E6Q38_03800 [Crocinitomicaceae bacterium]|nr:MAG: hypothetical protein E6Q38_03800 [Crocinitomicaceae bacterium]
MERISIFNYEAFYLDFLEGTLSEEETALFLAFLEEHPELQLEDENLFAIDEDQAVLDASFKENLKQLNFETTAITLNNVEQFLIAQTEGLLSSTKHAELNVFLAQDPALLHAQRVYAHTKMNPDLSIVYADKSSLKQARRVALWPVISLAAAASVAVFFFIQTPSLDFGAAAGSTAKIHFKGTLKPVTPVNETPTTLIQTLQTTVESDPQQLATIINVPNKRTVVDHLKAKRLNKIRTDEVENEVEFLEATSAPVVSKFEHKVGAVGFQDMKNPIKPITNRLSDAVKQEVDFRTAKATNERSGGFYLKIGKLEISHRRNRK